MLKLNASDSSAVIFFTIKLDNDGFLKNRLEITKSSMPDALFHQVNLGSKKDGLV
ncbi:MAG: hypothetical protein ACJ72X_08590 [Nitrososphaeraceae archaeon]